MSRSIHRNRLYNDRRSLHNLRMTLKKAGDWVLVAGLIVILYLCFRILQPFLVPIFAALILCTLLAPLHTAVTQELRGSTKPRSADCLHPADGGHPRAGRFPIRVVGK
jgi:hypothetical protein